VSTSGTAVNSQGGTPVCAVGTTCTYTLSATGSYNVEGIGLAQVLNSLIKTSVNVTGSGAISCDSTGGGDDLQCTFTPTISSN
jgi:hypothetical protein